MKRNFKFDIPSKIILYILALVGVVLLFISYTTGFSGGAFSVVAEYVFVPMQKGLDIAGEHISINARDTATKQDLIEENEKLQQEIEELRTRLTNVSIRESELEELRKLFELDSEYNNYDTTGAYIIGRGGSNWFNTFTIDKGKKDGIKENMNVIASGGLVGIVISVGDNFSTVRAIIDDTSNVSAMIVDTSDNCIVSGNLETMTGSNMIKISGIEDPDDRIAVGMPVVTSNISDKFVPNILIGYISEISVDGNGLTKSGKLTPIADFKHLSQVLVINQIKETGN